MKTQLFLKKINTVVELQYLLQSDVNCMYSMPEQQLQKTIRKRSTIQHHLEKSRLSYGSFLEGAGQCCSIFVCSRTASVTL